LPLLEQTSVQARNGGFSAPSPMTVNDEHSVFSQF